MASRKEQKEQARAARIAATQAAEAAEARRRRMGVLAGLVVCAVIVVAVVVVISSGGGSAGLQSPAGVPEAGTRLGDPKANVTMTYFGDLECPVCRDFTLSVLPGFIGSYVRSGKVKIVYRSLCTATCHFNTSRFVPQQVAAYAAGSQDRFWQYAELFYREQGDETQPYVTEQFLQGLAKQIPKLKFSKWLLDRKDPGLASQVQSDEQMSLRLGVPQQTPEVMMSGPGGSVVVPATGAPTSAWLANAVKRVS
jgi:protein-disulfide isomerase